MVVSDPEFYKKLLQVSSEVQMKPEDLLNVMAVESGIDPTAHNANGNASGLIQFMPSTLKGLGFQGSHADFRHMSSVDQLDYVKKYIQGNMKYNGGPFTSAAQYYVANFLPVALQLPGIKQGDPKTILAAQNPTAPHLPGVNTHMESVYYNANAGLDADHDGAITYGDIQTVLNRAAAGKNFRTALAQLQNNTGYQPAKNYLANPASMVASNKPTQTLPDQAIDNLLNQYLQQVEASDRSNKKLYQKYLPNHCLVIKIAAPTITDGIEFARVLKLALDEELLATAFTHLQDNQVEVECSIAGPLKECVAAINELSETVAKAFEQATAKIGGIKVKTQLVINKKSSYQPLTVKASETQHRKFLLKFIKG
jgi:transglycosylase-like protein with SLT domain